MILLIGRLVQSIGAGCGITLARAIARDVYGADRLISLVRADEGTRFYHLDGLGSVTALTDLSGAVTSRLQLDAWGVFRNPNAPDGLLASKNRFAFTGYVFDREIVYSQTNLPPEYKLDDTVMLRLGFDF